MPKSKDYWLQFAEAERAAALRYRDQTLLLNLASREARKDSFDRYLKWEPTCSLSDRVDTTESPIASTIIPPQVPAAWKFGFIRVPKTSVFQTISADSAVQKNSAAIDDIYTYLFRSEDINGDLILRRSPVEGWIQLISNVTEIITEQRILVLFGDHRLIFRVNYSGSYFECYTGSQGHYLLRDLQKDYQTVMEVSPAQSYEEDCE
ncbi:MAG: hypothetical protein JNM40_18390 [Myxococcales bacterium]|nr:hypothetical protein [Myxococcales bacterium]